jgi:serine/threonine protein kinase
LSTLSVIDGKAVGVGTPRYAAPEQFTGGEISPAADIHALGMLVNECFGGNPEGPWERIVACATSSIPERRYHDIGAFMRAATLRCASAHLPVGTNSARWGQRALPGGRKKRKLAVSRLWRRSTVNRMLIVSSLTHPLRPQATYLYLGRRPLKITNADRCKPHRETASYSVSRERLAFNPPLTHVFLNATSAAFPRKISV